MHPKNALTNDRTAVHSPGMDRVKLAWRHPHRCGPLYKWIASSWPVGTHFDAIHPRGMDRVKAKIGHGSRQQGSQQAHLVRSVAENSLIAIHPPGTDRAQEGPNRPT